MKSTYPKNAFSIALMLITTALPVLTAVCAPRLIDIPLDYVPIVDYHPTIILGDPVVIANPQAYATPLVTYSWSDYLDSPLGIYVNGVEARVIQNEKSVSDEAYEFGLVEIAIGGNGLDSGFSGFIQKQYLASPGAQAPSLPAVTLKAQGAEDIALLLDFTEDAPIVATYSNGAQAQLLGYLDDMCHVQIGDQSGFVKTSQLELPQAVAQGLHEALPGQFDSTTPQAKHSGFIRRTYLDERTAQYGSHDTWPLWLNAEFSALSIQLGCGTGFSYGVNIIPGPDELPEQEAMGIAVQAIYDSLGITQETLLQFSSSAHFYDSNYDRTGHYWYFSFWRAPNPALPIEWLEISVSSPAGEAVGLRWYERLASTP